ncbi:MAG: SGNH/GDSL hydrolase family protein [Deltaproteobacteria bacterium]|nr:SGNH/GDSL hydrolase family protein [Deltaproteobacteria bacterium]
MGRIKALDLLVMLLILAIGVVAFCGFLRPDPYYLEKGLVASALLWLLRIGVPLLTLLILSIYLAIRRGKISGPLVGLMCFSAAVALALGYPVADYLYQKSYVQQIEKYHPYLQIRPQNAPADLKRDELFLIMCVGGSTTEFADVEGQGWEGRLQKLLPETIDGKKVKVLNMGKQWYTTQHVLINYELNLRHLKPDVLIVMESVNDLLTNADFSYISHGSFRPDYGHFYGPVNRLIDRKGLVGFLADMIAGLWNYTPREMITTKEFPGLASYERNVRTLLDFAKLDGTKVVLMSEPYFFKPGMSEEERKTLQLLNYQAVGPTKQWTIETAIAGMEAYNAKMAELAKSGGAHFIDLEKSIPKTLEYFYDEVHYRQNTFPLVASAVAEGLKNSGVLR